MERRLINVISSRILQYSSSIFSGVGGNNNLVQFFCELINFCVKEINSINSKINRITKHKY